jgi:hypothetical protein
MYTRITFTKYRSFCMKTLQARLTNLSVLLLQSCDCSYYVSRRILASPPPPTPGSDSRNTLIYARMTWRTFPTCEVSLGSLTLPASEAGDFVELLLILRKFYSVCTVHVYQVIVYQFAQHNACSDTVKAMSDTFRWRSRSSSDKTTQQTKKTPLLEGVYLVLHTSLYFASPVEHNSPCHTSHVLTGVVGCTVGPVGPVRRCIRLR